MFTLANINVKNKVLTSKYDGGEMPKILSHIIKERQIDIICAEEVTPNYVEKLMSYLPNYQLTGKYRLTKKEIFENHSNESNPIITNQKVIETNTYSLSKNIWMLGKRSFLSLLPRIATVTTIEINNSIITIINTHLDHLTDIARKKQLEYLKQIIEKYRKNQIILTGDFNLNEDNPLFIKFAKEMEKQNLKLIKTNTSTFNTPFASLQKGPLKNFIITSPDHIFASRSLKIIETKVLEDQISDHKMILTKIK